MITNGYSTLGSPVLLNLPLLLLHLIIDRSQTQTKPILSPPLSLRAHTSAWLISPHTSPSFVLWITLWLLNRHKLMAQYLSPNNRVSGWIEARPGSRVAAVADGGGQIPDDAVLEEARVALTCSMALHHTRGCTLTLGTALFGATLSWLPKAPPWPSDSERINLDVADPLTCHFEEEEKEERQVLYIYIFSIY